MYLIMLYLRLHVLHSNNLYPRRLLNVNHVMEYLAGNVLVAGSDSPASVAMSLTYWTPAVVAMAGSATRRSESLMAMSIFAVTAVSIFSTPCASAEVNCGSAGVEVGGGPFNRAFWGSAATSASTGSDGGCEGASCWVWLGGLGMWIGLGFTSGRTDLTVFPLPIPSTMSLKIAGKIIKGRTHSRLRFLTSVFSKNPLD